VVDESEGKGADIRIRAKEENVSKLSLRCDEGVINININIKNDEVIEISAVKPRDEEVTGTIINEVVKVAVNKDVKAIINGDVNEEVVDDEEEVFNAFDNNKDEDYRESNEDVIKDSEASSEVGFDRSNDEEDKESNGEVDDDEEEGLSEVKVKMGDDGNSEVINNDEEEVVRVVNWRARKWKI
jgi:hypothetical protein